MTPEQEREKRAAEQRLERENYAEEKSKAIMEQEANYFAMELLMPTSFLLKDAKGIDITDDVAVARLAKKYKVGVGLMGVRLGQIADRL